jgi:hypothetical protein
MVECNFLQIASKSQLGIAARQMTVILDNLHGMTQVERMFDAASVVLFAMGGRRLRLWRWETSHGTS